MSIISQKNDIKHWIDTPLGSYIGNPNYGNNFHNMIFMSFNNKGEIIDDVSDKILEDLGLEIASTIKEISILYDEDNNSYHLAIVVIENNKEVIIL